MTIQFTKSWWAVFVGAWLILVALGAFGILSAPPVLLGLLALFGGVLLLFGR